MKKVLITGMSGFIGAHIAEGILKNTDWHIVGLDRYGKSGMASRIMDMDRWKEFEPRIRLHWHDLRSPISGLAAHGIGNDITHVFHLAASSHVDRSIEHPMDFVMDNVVGTCNILDWARKLPKLEQFIYFSTDEVFGPAPKGVAYKEWDRYRSGNPYAATKAGGEELAISFENTYKMPLIVTHTMNVFGERQHPEKFIPLVIKKSLVGSKLTVHGNKDRTESGTRFYIHARNVAAALMFLTEHGNWESGEKYNIVGEREVSNLEMAQFIHKVVSENVPAVPELNFEIVDFHSSRPGHDLRYALDGQKLHDMGFTYPKNFEQSLRKTVEWTLQNRKWLMLSQANLYLVYGVN